MATLTLARGGRVAAAPGAGVAAGGALRAPPHAAAGSSAEHAHVVDQSLVDVAHRGEGREEDDEEHQGHPERHLAREVDAEGEDEDWGEDEAGDRVEHREQRVKRLAEEPIPRERVADDDAHERADHESHHPLEQRYAHVVPERARAEALGKPAADTRKEERRARVVELVEDPKLPEDFPRADEEHDHRDLKRADEPRPPTQRGRGGDPEIENSHPASRLRAYKGANSSRPSSPARSQRATEHGAPQLSDARL